VVKNVKITSRIYRNIILPLVLYGRENVVSDFKGGTQTEDVCEQGAGEDIWTEEG
jgi:hypothetical protein